jgi:hypothetical protein
MTKRGRVRMPVGGSRSPRLSRDAFPALKNFLRSYLHEDFPEVHGSVRAAAAAFCADASAEDRRQLAGELESLTNLLASRPARVLRRFVTDDLGSRWELKSRGELVELLALIRPAAGE